MEKKRGNRNTCKECGSFLTKEGLCNICTREVETTDIKCTYCSTVNTIEPALLTNKTMCKKCYSYLDPDETFLRMERPGYYGYGFKKGEFIGKEYGRKKYAYEEK